MKELRDFQEELDRSLIPFVESTLEDFNALHHSPLLTDYANHAIKLILGGKRIRPFMCLLGLKAGRKSPSENTTKIFLGLELFHVFCLIHDDIIDRSPQRRTVPTLHTYIEQSLQNIHISAEKRHHFSEGQALLFGDLIYQFALQCLTTESDPEVRGEIFAMINEVVAGQMIDVQTTVTDSATDQDIERKMYYKTTSYTFVRPFRIGLALAQIPASERSRLSVFAEHLGRAFQIQDDYLDLTGDPSITGKPILSDIREGQHTLFSNHVLENGSEVLKNQFKACFGKEVSDEELSKLQQSIRESGLLDATKNAFEEAYQDALTHLAQLDIQQEVKTILINLTENLIVRMK